MVFLLANTLAATVSRADSRIRTDDLLITNQLLYQLSYAGKKACSLYRTPFDKQGWFNAADKPRVMRCARRTITTADLSVPEGFLAAMGVESTIVLPRTNNQRLAWFQIFDKDAKILISVHKPIP